MTSDPPLVVDRLSVPLVAGAAEALSRLQARTGMRRADIINRALSVYDFFDAEQRAGNTLLIQSPDGTARSVDSL